VLVVATPVATPLTVMVILVVSDDVHVAVLVMSCVKLSVNVAIAVYCFGAWRTRAALAGVTAMEAMGDAETVRDAGGLTMEPSVAVIEVVPPAIPAAVPWIPGELLIVAMDGLEDAQVTVEVITLVLLSAYVPVAEYSWLVLVWIVCTAGVTAIDTSGFVTVSVAVPETPP
jgi:hypothetical protein